MSGDQRNTPWNAPLTVSLEGFLSQKPISTTASQSSQHNTSEVNRPNKPQRRHSHIVRGQGSWGDEDFAHTRIANDSQTNTGRRKSTTSIGGVKSLFNGKFNKDGSKKHSVEKATSKDEAAPKVKHLQRVLQESWDDRREGVATVFGLLMKRPILSYPVVALKALLVAHKLLLQGPPEVLPEAYERMPFFQSLCEGNADGSPHGSLVFRYAMMLAEKTNFHHSHPAFANNYSFDSRRERVITNDPSLGPLRSLFRIQELVLTTLLPCLTTVLEKGRNSKGTYALRLAVTLSLLREADLVYEICVYLLGALVTGSAVSEDLADVLRRFDCMAHLLPVAASSHDACHSQPVPTSRP
ncbi:hypothetical protein CYMTET_27857 [Cymbomonas tetramitiformis]|uniref:ENTH domain-containing protein n=1 Tax=Cymbomonas tetramitiformis TaxID=36881 RepID=A0AAE0KWR6_9CHLO|nr:hypothetical protein CYMTET_27857 [Cymbomonas tetramitiformis]